MIIIDGTGYPETTGIHFFPEKYFLGFAVMKSIRQDQYDIILVGRNDNGLRIVKRINIPSVDQGFQVKEAEHGLVFSLKYDIIGALDNFYFNALMMAVKSPATSEAPPTRPPSKSGQANNSAALPAFTLPPYNTGI